MNEVIAILLEKFKGIVPESFYRINTNQVVIYPYLTFNYTSDSVNQHTSSITLEIDIFDDMGNDDERLETTLFELQKHFVDDNSRILNDNVFIRFDNIRTNTIPTMSDTLQRRNAQIICRVDWRK